MYTLDIAIPCPLPQSFSYLSQTQLAPGVRVLVPFGKRQMVGVVLGVQEQPAGGGATSAFTLKPIVQVIDEEPVYSPTLLRLGRWMSAYYHHPVGEVFKAMLPSGNSKVKKETWQLTSVGEQVRAGGSFDPRQELLKALFPQKLKLAAASVRANRKKWEVKHGQAIPSGEWQELFRSGLMATSSEASAVWRPSGEGEAVAAEEAAGVLPATMPELTPLQAEVVATIAREGLDHIGSSTEKKPFLLFGVTGSGKTEVYLRLIAYIHQAAQAKSEGGLPQTLVLVPEISLTPQMTRVFEQRFAGQVAVVHSALSEAERWRQLERIRSGQAVILIGPRSAVFGPFRRLGLIIVDEEHDGSYKQNSHLPYHGRDIAVLRAKLDEACVVLGSATPSLESFANADTGRYHLVRLKERVHQQDLPAMQVIAKKPGRYGVAVSADTLPDSRVGMGGGDDEAAGGRVELPIAAEIVEGLQGVLARGEQAMVIVNRRGYAYYLIDMNNRETILCPHCSISLTLHMARELLRCHYCDYQTKLAQVLEEHPQARFFAVGHGSQKVEHALCAALPAARIARLDSDIAVKRERLAEVLAAFRAGETDILVGTQILAKGHDFPRVTLIAMLEVDAMLDLPDFRAGERTFQLMVQAAGRAGRAGLPGHVLVQTLRAQHPVVQAGLTHDYEGFAKRELGFRQAHGYPPFGRLVAIEFSSTHMGHLEACTAKVESWLMRLSKERRALFEQVKVLGPATPSIEKIRQRFRRTMILASPSAAKLHAFVTAFRAEFPRFAPTVRVNIDVDPQSLL